MNKKQKQKTPITKGVAKVPVIMQMEALECGAASLTMIMAYYGKSGRHFLQHNHLSTMAYDGRSLGSSRACRNSR